MEGPTEPRVPFASRVAAILRDADRGIRRLPSGDYHRLYDFLRATMGKIARVDAFYVGFYRENSSIAYPYTYDQQEYATPGIHTYGANGLAAWLLQHKKPYTYASDDGRLLGGGHRFGDTTRASRDAVTVPLIDDSSGVRQVLGLASMQSYEPGSYDDQAVRAFEWLSRSVMAVLRREHEDLVSLRELDGVAGVGPTFADLVVDLSNRVEVLRLAAGRLKDTIAAGGEALAQAEELEQQCVHVQQETFAVLTRPSVDALEPLSLLTSREREIADLVRDRLTNQQIADALTISVPTVKTHVHNIMKKFKVRQRSEIVAKLHPFG